MKNETGRAVRLPYLDNWKPIAITLAVNMLCAYVFWKSGFGCAELLTDTVWCGMITAAINVFIVRRILQKRASGFAPSSIPQSGLVRILPKHPVALAVILGLVCGLLMAGVNFILLRIYGIAQLNLPQYITWKAIYSYWLSAWVLDFAILRLVQPDAMITKSAGKAHGDLHCETGESCLKKPTLRLEFAAGFLKGMIFDFGFNVAFGLVLGGTVIRGMEVILAPTPCQGTEMVIATGITGIIVTFFVVPPIVRALAEAKREGEKTSAKGKNTLLRLLPAGPYSMAFALCFVIAPLTILICWRIFILFEFDTLNFFQFYMIRALYIPLLCKAVLPLAIRRLW